MSGFEPPTGTSTTRSGSAARIGPRPRSPTRLVDELEGVGLQENGVRAAAVGVARDDDRLIAGAAGRDERPDHLRSRPRLVAEDDDGGRTGGSISARRRSRPGASSTDGAGPGLRTRCSVEPVDAVLDLLGSVPEDHDDVLDARPRGRRRGRARGSAGRRGARAPWVSRTGSPHPPQGRRPRLSPGAGRRVREARGLLDHRPARSRRSAIATTSAMIASAVSAGARPPRSSPTGPRSRASSSSLTPAARRRSRRSPWVLRLPTAPT